MMGCRSLTIYGQQIWSIGLEVMGLRQLFSAGLGLLGIDSKMDPDNILALKEFYQWREERRRSSERERQKLLEPESQHSDQGEPH